MDKKDCFCIALVVRKISDGRSDGKSSLFYVIMQIIMRGANICLTAVLDIAVSGAVAEHFVREDPCEDQAQGKCGDDQDGGCKPGGGNI